MGYGINRGVHRISLEPFDGSGNWVDIRATRSYGAMRRLQGSGLRYKVGAGNTQEIDYDFEGAAIALMATSIVAWSLKADEGDAEPMPVNEETFRERLDASVGEWLAGEIDAYYKPKDVSPGDLKNLNAP